MFAIAFIIFLQCFRMSFIAILIINIFGDIKNSTTYIITGMISAIITSSLIAFLAKSLFISFGGLGDEILSCILLFFIIILIIGALLVSTINNNIDDKIYDTKNKILLFSIFFVTLNAIFEIIIKIYAISSTITASDNMYTQALIIGIILNFIISYLVYLLFNLYLKSIEICKILLTLICSGFAAQIIGILSGASIINLLSQNLWDSSQIISDQTFFGYMLYIITGYVAKPTILQFIIYVCTFAIIHIITITKSSFRLGNNK